jgi:Putative amidoligase enzyme
MSRRDDIDYMARAAPLEGESFAEWFRRAAGGLRNSVVGCVLRATAPGDVDWWAIGAHTTLRARVAYVMARCVGLCDMHIATWDVDSHEGGWGELVADHYRMCTNHMHCGLEPEDECSDAIAHSKSFPLNFKFTDDMSTLRGRKQFAGLNRFLGAEIEVNDAKAVETSGLYPVRERLAAALDPWRVNVVPDGSISGPRGCEFVTQPAKGSQWLKMIREIGKAFKAVGAVPDKSCGLHIHVDARDLTAWDVRRFIKVYAAVEPALFAAVHPNRRRAHYSKECGLELMHKFKPLWWHPKHINAIIGPLQYEYCWTHLVDDSVRSGQLRASHSDVKHTSGKKYHDTRYRAVNLHSWWHRGTIEFRHHHGTTDPSKIENWGIVCGSIVDWCANHNDTDAEQLCAGTPAPALLEIVKYGPARAWLLARWMRFSPTKAGTPRRVRARKDGEV